jgi:hypothetical protein
MVELKHNTKFCSIQHHKRSARQSPGNDPLLEEAVRAMDQAS